MPGKGLGMLHPPEKGSARPVQRTAKRAGMPGEVQRRPMPSTPAGSKHIFLLHQIHDQEKVVMALSWEQGRFNYSGSLARPFTRVGFTPCCVARGELLRLLSESPFEGLSKALKGPKSDLHQSYRGPLTQAAIRLADAVHSPLSTGQLLGAFTILEMLLTPDGSNFSQLKRRITALLGGAALKANHVEDVIEARNRYVHEGVSPGSYLVSAHAIALALSCLLRYAEAAGRIPNRGALTEYLDTLGHAEFMAAHWGEEGRKLLEGLVKHTRDGHKFNFVEDRVRQERDRPSHA
jgi:hypothetical protein